MAYKFNVGDLVRIVDDGKGCAARAIGETATILETGVYKYDRGYRITATVGETNSMTGGYGGFIGEESFELVSTSKKIKVSANPRLIPLKIRTTNPVTRTKRVKLKIYRLRTF